MCVECVDTPCQKNTPYSILQKADFLAQNAPKSFVAGLRPPDPLGELTALPQTPLAAFDGPTSKRGEGRGEKGRR